MGKGERIIEEDYITAENSAQEAEYQTGTAVPKKKPKNTSASKEEKRLIREEMKRRRKRILKVRNQRIHRLLTVVILACMIIFTVANLFKKDRAYSETENKMLAQRPAFSMGQIFSGQFMTDMENYIADQFVLRDKWINMKLAEDMLLGKRESNGVYIGKHKQLLEIPDAPNQVAVDRNLKAIHDFAARQQDINTVMALVPNAAYICDQLKPFKAPVRDQAADIAYVESAVGDALTYVNLIDTMSAHKTEAIYYKTDHHWTTLGAKYAFDTLAGSLEIANAATGYDIYPVTTGFSGTLASKSGYNKTTDTIDLYVPQGVSSECIVNYIDEGKRTASMYESSALENKDKYEVFFGGNHTRVDINTPLSDKKNLLILKDSYANCFIPFLVPYYRNIIIIDPRYYYDDIDKLISENEITDILFLYNVNTFMGDNSLADVLSAE